MKSLIVTFEHPSLLSPSAVLKALHQFHPSLDSASLDETQTVETPEGIVLVIEWGDCAIRFFQMNHALPEAVMQACVAPASYDDSLKQGIVNHQSHALLHYLGPDNISDLDQYVVLSMIATALNSLGATGVLNETAYTSSPMVSLIAPTDQDQITYLSTLPLALLYCGTVVFQLEGTSQLWARTYGAQVFGLPNYAYELKEALYETQPILIFSELLHYALHEAPLKAGDTLNMGIALKIRNPYENEHFLHDQAGAVLVLESC